MRSTPRVVYATCAHACVCRAIRTPAGTGRERTRIGCASVGERLGRNVEMLDFFGFMPADGCVYRLEALLHPDIKQGGIGLKSRGRVQSHPTCVQFERLA